MVKRIEGLFNSQAQRCAKSFNLVCIALNSSSLYAKPYNFEANLHIKDTF